MISTLLKSKRVILLIVAIFAILLAGMFFNKISTLGLRSDIRKQQTEMLNDVKIKQGNIEEKAKVQIDASQNRVAKDINAIDANVNKKKADLQASKNKLDEYTKDLNIKTKGGGYIRRLE